MPIQSTGGLVEVLDVTMNSSDKRQIVPVDKCWRLVHVWAKLTSTSTAGNRQLDVHLVDPSGRRVGTYVSGAVQVASRTQYYSFAPGHADATAFAPNADNGTMIRSIGSEVWLLPGSSVRVFDSAAIAAAADDLSVSLLVEETLAPVAF